MSKGSGALDLKVWGFETLQGLGVLWLRGVLEL